MNLNDWMQLSIHTSIHCICMILFLTCFYFFYVYPVERRTIQDVIRNILTDAFSDFFHNRYRQFPNGTAGLSQFFNSSMMMKLRNDAIVAQRQLNHTKKQTMIITFIVIIIAAITLFLIHFMIWRAHRKRLHIRFREIMYSIMFSIGFIIIIEITFFLFISKRLQPVTTDELNVIIVDTVLSILNTRYGLVFQTGNPQDGT